MNDTQDPIQEDTAIAIIQAYSHGRLSGEELREFIDEDTAQMWIFLSQTLSPEQCKELFGTFLLMQIFRRVDEWSPPNPDDDGGLGIDPDEFR